MKHLRISLGVTLLLGFGALTTFLILASTPMPAIEAPGDVFGFGELSAAPRPEPSAPLERYVARDGSALAYRFYDSAAETLLVFVHGSSYHSAGYEGLARAISASGAAKVYLPNLRGHYQSGRRRGDIDYIGQLEDDIADLIAFAREQGHAGPVVLGGHSSGGGFAIRFGGGPHKELASALVLLAPVIPTAPSVRGGDAGGWAVLNGKRLAGLIGLNVLGIHAFDALPIIAFNKPEAYWDGTETLTYTYRLNTGMHPPHPYADTLAAIAVPTLVLVGADDEANDATAYAPMLAEAGVEADVEIMDGVDHFRIFSDPLALGKLADWLRAHAAPATAAR